MANTPSPAFGMLDSFTSSPGGKVISDLFDLCFFTGACKKDNKISFVNHISLNIKQNYIAYKYIQTVWIFDKKANISDVFSL